MTLHTELIDNIISHYGERLVDTPQQSYDAVTLSFTNNTAVEIRFAGEDEYSLKWNSAEKEFRIDTAPLHPELSTFPNHLHLSNGEMRADPFTTPGNPPWENVKAVLDNILENPIIE